MNQGFFRSKPVVIRAFQMTEERINDNQDWPEWLHEAWNKDRSAEGSLHLHYMNPRTFAVGTLEGPMIVTPDDWIIKGTRGEIYPCKPNVFKDKYEETEAPL